MNRRNLKRSAKESVSGDLTEPEKRMGRAEPSYISDDTTKKFADMDHQLGELRKNLTEALQALSKERAERHQSGEGTSSSAAGGAIELILKRQLLNGKLPRFDGNHREWPTFINRLENSTWECQLTDDENLERLQDALSGEALNLVKDNLVDAKDIHRAINTLKETYGHPQVIIDRAQQDAANMPNLRNDLKNLPAFVAESRRIEKATELVGGYKVSEMIFLQLEKRLPSTLLFEWGRQCHNSEIAALATDHLRTDKQWICS